MENPTKPSTSLDPKLFRRALGCFATGVTIVTTKSGESLNGMTVNAFTSVSLQPALVLVCLADGARTTAAVKERGWFAIDILEQSQQQLSSLFAKPGEDRFRDLDYSLDQYDLPVLPGSLAHMACKVYQIDARGDHQIVYGEVVNVEIREGAPLLFFGGAYAAVAPQPSS